MSLKLATAFHTGLESFKALVLLFLISILTFYYFKEQSNTKSKAIPSKKRKIKDLPAFKTFPFWTPPIIEGLAVLYQIHKRGIKVIFDLWALKNYPPLASLTAPNFQKILFVSDPDLIKKCLSSHDPELLSKPKIFYEKIAAEIMKDGLFASNYTIWKPHRKILNKIFTYGMLQKQFKVVDSCAHQLIKDLDRINPTIKVDQFSPLIYDTLIKIILDMLIGSEIVEKMGIEKPIEKFRLIKKLNQYRLFYPHYSIDFIWKLSPKGKMQSESISYMMDYFDLGIERVIQVGKAENFSAVEHMLENKMTKKEIREEMATLIVGGHETTDITIHFLMQNLGENLDIQRKCQEEVDALFNSKNSPTTMDDLAKLKYLEQCILETLRLAPVFPGFGRELKKDFVLDDVLVEKGTILVFCPWIVHRHPDYYPDAEKFDPDRFTLEKVQPRHPYAFIPFSSGPRNCIGWKLAMMEVKTIASWILRHYNIYTNDKVADIKLTCEVTLMPERKFDLWLEKRK